MKPVIINSGWNKNDLWNGCMLAAIAHAIMVAHYPELSYEHSWDEINYNTIDGSGGRGTVTFHDQYCVAAFRNDYIVRTEFSSAVDFFRGAPKEVLELANNETLQYLLEDEEDGVAIPSITSAFWGEKDKIFSLDSNVKLIQNGGYLLERQLMNYDSGLESWQEYYDMTEKQLKLLESIYKRKIANPNAKIKLTKDEISMIGTDDPEGLNESRISFEEIGVYW